MNVYVETNFVLELVFEQEQHTSCEQILALCEGGSAHLIVPAYCLAEPHEKLTRQARSRRELQHRNSKDFDNPDIVDELTTNGCTMMPRFDHGYGFIQARLQA